MQDRGKCSNFVGEKEEKSDEKQCKYNKCWRIYYVMDGKWYYLAGIIEEVPKNLAGIIEKSYKLLRNSKKFSNLQRFFRLSYERACFASFISPKSLYVLRTFLKILLSSNRRWGVFLTICFALRANYCICRRHMRQKPNDIELKR